MEGFLEYLFVTYNRICGLVFAVEQTQGETNHSRGRMLSSLGIPLIVSLHDACFHDDIERVEEFIQGGVDPCATEFCMHLGAGQTPLHSAAKGKNVGVMKVLIPHILAKCPSKIDALTECEKKETPLHIASLRGSVECVRELLENGADPEKTNAFGQTPDQLAQENLESDQTYNDPDWGDYERELYAGIIQQWKANLFDIIKLLNPLKSRDSKALITAVGRNNKLKRIVAKKAKGHKVFGSEQFVRQITDFFDPKENPHRVGQ